MLERPSGTVTFLFTDIEGSTELWEGRPEEMAVALELHDRIVHDAIGLFGGYVFSTGGDGFGVAFGRAGDAVGAADAVQRELGQAAWNDGVVLRVRMGLHVGEVQERGGDYFGPAVNRAARVMGAGHGGQVLLSGAVRELVPEVKVVDLGEHVLRGVAERVGIWQLGDGEFGPLRVGGGEGNLPVPVTSFVGRRNEISDLVDTVVAGRAVSLVGVGGTGKTRLVLEVAAQLGERYPDGVWFCDLAPIGDPANVVDAVASSLQVRQQPGMSMLESVVDAASGRRLLIVLDNCEHVLATAAEVVAALTTRASSVAVVTTSREPLAIAGEVVWSVPALDAAAELFVARAAEADARFSPTGNDLAVISRICEQLDRIPLAIELAAARARSLSPADIEQRLADRFRLLRGWGRGAVERHQTLAATVQWSYELLTEPERILFDRLCVFAGSFDLGAVEQICADGEVVDEFDVIDLIAALVDKSMVGADRSGTSMRYRLLETFRQFGEQRLDPEQLAELRNAHLDHYLSVSWEADARHIAGGYAQADGIYRVEWDNVRAAMQWALANHDTTKAASLVDGVHWFGMWHLRSEVGDWAEQIIAEGGAPSFMYGVAAFFRGVSGDHVRQVALASEGLELDGWAINGETYRCWGPYTGGIAYLGSRAEFERAARSAREAAGLFRHAAGAYWSALLAAPLMAADPEEATRFADDAERQLAAGVGPSIQSHTLQFLSRYYAVCGRHDVAVEKASSSLAVAREHELPWSVVRAVTNLAFLASIGAIHDGSPVFRDAIDIAERARAHSDLQQCLHHLVRWWADHGELEPAGVVLGHLASTGGDTDSERATIDESARQAIEASAGHQSWLAHGETMSQPEITDYVMENLN